MRILDAAPVGVAVLRGPALEVELANPAFRELACDGGDPVGRPLGEVSPALAAVLGPRLAHTARDRTPVEVKDVPLPRRRAADPQRWASFRVRALPDEPGRARAVLVLGDETTSRVVALVREDALAALAGDLHEGRSLPDVLERAAATARDLLGAATAFVLVADPDSHRLRGRAPVGDGVAVEISADVTELPSGALAVARREPVVFRSEEARRLEAAWLRGGGRASGLCAPLAAADRPVGLLYLTWTDGAPAGDDVKFAASVASACSLAVQRSRIVRLEREARLASHRATERLELLAESGALLTGAVDWPSVVRTTAQLGLGYLADIAVLDLVTADGVLRREAVERAGDPPGDAVDATADHHEVKSPTIQDALLTRRTRRMLLPAGGASAESGDPDLAILDVLGATSCISAPLVIRGRAAGVLTLVRRVPSPPHDATDVALATEIARRAALALDDARLLATAADEAAARDAFLAAAAHDIRSPVTALMLGIESLERRDGIDRDVRLRVERLQGVVERLARLVEQVLEAARAARHASPVRREALDLAELVRHVVERIARERGKDAAPVRFLATTPILGRWDPSRADAIVTNLVAVASKRGGDEVEVRVDPEPSGGRIEVRRPSLAPESATAEDLAAAEHEDLEVGLWIARRFAEAHGGALRVVRAPNVGARFTVDLPG